MTTPDQNAALIDSIIKALPQILTMIAAFFAWWQSRKNSSDIVKVDTKLEVVHSKVDGLTSELVKTTKEKGEAATQAATDVGAAQTKAAHAEGHLEGVLTEQERGIREQVRVEEAKRKNPPPADTGLANAVGKIADVVEKVASKVAPDPEVKK